MWGVARGGGIDALVLSKFWLCHWARLLWWRATKITNLVFSCGFAGALIVVGCMRCGICWEGRLGLVVIYFLGGGLTVLCMAWVVWGVLSGRDRRF
ncbi:MAG: hypothetical protein COB04_01405 [Gammaproteobacteria bacterium]|nr:MAG: hypothetical protein COB04_01405 [Gammaproteobacteria bacterium]